MKQRLGAAAIAAAFLLTVSPGAGAAGLATLTVDPSSGPPSSQFTVSGSGCFDTAQVSTNVAEPAFQEATPDGSGNWSATFTVPANAAADSTIQIEASCSPGGPAFARSTARGESGFSYQPAEFTVTAGSGSTTSTSTTTSSIPTTPTSQPTDPLPTSNVADDVVSTPALTG